MKALERRGGAAIAALALAAAVLLLGRLGAYGFWDPHEIAIADDASSILEGASPADVVADRPRLPVEIVAAGVRVFGASELGARLPLAILGILAIVATALLASRLAGRAAGLVTGAVLATSPLALLGARILTGNIAVTAGGALLALGAAGLAWSSDRRPVLIAGNAGAAIAGALLAAGAGGGLVGVFPVLGGLAIALALASRWDGERRRRLRVAAAVVGAAALASIVYAFAGAVDWVAAQPGDRALFGKTLAAAKDGHASLGGAWRARVPEDRTWNLLFENVAFGLFPWVVLAPFALRWAGRSDGGPPGVRFAGAFALCWAVLGWLAATVFAIKVRPVAYPAAPAIALAIGLWLSRRDRDEAGGLPLAGAAVALFALILARDLQVFPAELPAVALDGGTFTWPKDLWILALVPPAFGVAFAAVAGLAVARPASPEEPAGRLEQLLAPARRATAALGRHGVAAMLATAALFALALSWLYLPALSSQMSYKALFDRVAAVADSEAPLGLFNMRGSGARYYAGDSASMLGNRNELAQFLQRDERVFALAPRSELCPLHQGAARTGGNVFVLDDDNDKFLLLSNQLADDEVDRNPLAQSIRRSPPPASTVGTPMSVIFDDTIELIGVSAPGSVPRGSTFEMTLVFRVIKRPRRNWRVFVHFDGGGVRFQGDHHPLDKSCGTARWQPGDYIVDRFEVTAGNVAYGRTEYRIWAGFFTGAAGNWTNMPVSKGQHDDADRVAIGTISLR